MSVKQINNMNWPYGAHEKHIKQWFCNINLLGHSSCTVDFCRASVWRFLFFLLNLSHTRASPSPKPFTMVQLTPLIPCDILLQWAAWILGLLWSKCLLWPWWWRREFQYTPWNYIWRGSIAFISTYLKAKKDEGDPGMGIGQHMVVFPLKTLWFHMETQRLSGKLWLISISPILSGVMLWLHAGGWDHFWGHQLLLWALEAWICWVLVVSTGWFCHPKQPVLSPLPIIKTALNGKIATRILWIHRWDANIGYM